MAPFIHKETKGKMGGGNRKGGRWEEEKWVQDSR